jgi:hypothetical protein
LSVAKQSSITPYIATSGMRLWNFELDRLSVDSFRQ